MHCYQIFSTFLLFYIGLVVVPLIEARIESDSKEINNYHHHLKHLKDQAPTDATFRHRYHQMMHSHSPFGFMSKYFIRNRAQEHERKRRETQPGSVIPLQQLQQLQVLQQIQQAQQAQPTSQQTHKMLQQPQQNQGRIVYSSPPQTQFVRKVRQPQLYSSNGYTNYPRYQGQSQAQNFNGYSGSNQYYPRQPIARNNKWNAGPPIGLSNQYTKNIGFYGKPQTLNNYYRSNNGDYYKAYNVGKRPPYQQYKPYSQINGGGFNRINKRQDNSNLSISSKQQASPASNAGVKKQIKRKFRPIPIQS